MVSKTISIIRVLAVAWASSTGGVLLVQATTRVSVDSQAGQGDRGSGWPAISGKGQFVAFVSYALEGSGQRAAPES